MYHLINSNAGAVIQALRDIDLSEYLQLRKDLETNGACIPSRSYQAAYRKYWRMNAARLSPLFYERYFSLLAECWASGIMDLERVTRIISDPSGADHGLQFSFATKLLHMIDPTIPVFDSFVAAFYFFRPPASHRLFDERMSRLLDFHRFLRREYARIVDRDLLTPALRQLRQEEQLNPDVPDERLIDWLLWGWVSLLHRQTQFRGAALYD